MVDAATGYVFVEFQESLNTHETSIAKENFEAFSRGVGVFPQEYLSDNGKPFVSAEFAEDLKKFSQIIHFAGVGAHHSNGEAERAMLMMVRIARSAPS